MSTAALDAATLEKLISAAVSAPSVHNTQPWRYRLDPDTSTIELHAATERALRHADPLGRALHVSAGAAVFNLRVAVARFGWEPVVRLLPRPAEPDFLATVRLAGAPAGSGGQRHARLYDALWRRHSSRFPFDDRPVPAEVLAEIAEAAAAEGARITFPGAAESWRLLRLTAEAERFAVSDRDRSGESRSWVREGAPDGIPGAALGPRDSTGQVPVRDFTAMRPGATRPSAAFERHPLVAVLTTRHDTRADWLRAGQGLEHALLVATAHGVKSSMFSQAVEWPELRWALRDPRGGHGHVQMLARFGYGPEGPATPRRPARDVLDTGGGRRHGRGH
ncbi:nitroreductase family protein [Streptomyces sp. NPDC051976]|uniref:Acg family FMN-binding oxidoreductase n=1 Tax=Streptomyces sp. NPDC051976 TaxID=3154947 RepID=UPI00341C0ED3